MQSLRSLVEKLARREEGQGLSEYGLIIFLVSIVAIGALTLLGNNVSTLLNNVAAAF